MSFEILFILCLGIAFTPWVENRVLNANESPSIFIEDILKKLELNLNNYETITDEFAFANKECSLNINAHLSEPLPLILKPNSTEFFNSNVKGYLQIPYDNEISLYCNKGFAAPFENLKEIKPICKGDKNFQVNKRTYQFDQFICDKTNEYIARPTTRKCYDNSIIAEIGFEITNKNFVQLMELCHNEKSGSTYYVQHNLIPSNGKFQRNVTRPYFQQGKFFKNRNINKLYTQKEQIKTVGRILGGKHEKYFNISGDVYLARGHMAAKADYIYGIQQLATFFYVNVAPQWQTFNAGNWLAVENSVRRFVANKNLFLTLYTGTWGITSLKDSKGKFKELYLYSPTDGSSQMIPVPKLYYKVIIDDKSKKGIVLIGVNNPHLTLDEIKQDYIICNDISDQINWINWQKNDISLGYSYACSVPDFVKTVKHLPKLTVKGVLV